MLLFFLGATSGARAQEGPPCGARGEPVVRVAAAPFGAAFRAALATQLAVGLKARHIELCAGEDSPRSDQVAAELAFSGSPAAAVTVAVRDDVTGKLVVRDVDLGSVPVDARPLTLALAVDELLRASWAELTLADAPPPTRPVPREIADVVGAGRAGTPPPAAVERGRWQLGAALAAERFGGGSGQAGVDVAGRVSLRERLGLEGTIGLRRERPVNAPDGVVRGTAVEAALDADVVLDPRAGRWALDLLAGARLVRVGVTGDPRVGARGGDASATALYLGAGLRAGVRLTRAFGLALTGTFGVPLRPVDILDGAAHVAGLSGPLLSFALGARWRFR